MNILNWMPFFKFSGKFDDWQSFIIKMARHGRIRCALYHVEKHLKFNAQTLPFVLKGNTKLFISCRYLEYFGLTVVGVWWKFHWIVKISLHKLLSTLLFIVLFSMKDHLTSISSPHVFWMIVWNKLILWIDLIRNWSNNIEVCGKKFMNCVINNKTCVYT